MNKDDAAYELMEEKQEEYIKQVVTETTDAGIELTPFELEEIETAFEHGFAHGYTAALHKPIGKLN